MSDASADANAKMAATFSDVMRQLSLESDRGSVVLAVAWIDEQLKLILETYLLPSPAPSAKSDELLGANAPVATLSARIDLTYRLGLIRRYVAQSLHLCRRLRNDCAHLSEPVSLHDPAVRDKVLAILQLEAILVDALWEDIRHLPEIRALMGNRPAETSQTALLSTLGIRHVLHFTLAMVVASLVYIGTQVTQ